MDIRQLEYFAACCEQGSFNKAAACLYTTQPNVSKVISSLERELGRELFERGSKGIRLTPFGETIREYAGNILQNAGLIRSMTPANPGKKLSVATYSSNFMAGLLLEFYQKTQGKYVIEHLQGTVEEVTDYVKKGISEIGVVVLAKKHEAAFCHILGHKRQEFHHLGDRELCLFVGPRHPLYTRDSVNFDELSSLKFIRGARDYFSMEHHLEAVGMGVLNSENFHNVICSNSDFVYVNTLMHTDVCGLGIGLPGERVWIHDIRILPIIGCEPVLTVGYTAAAGQTLSKPAKEFVRLLKARVSCRTET